jgi:hypothetical protein
MLSALTAGSLLADIFESLPARRLTVSEINRLGRRLKHGLTVSPSDQSPTVVYTSTIVPMVVICIAVVLIVRRSGNPILRTGAGCFILGSALGVGLLRSG